MIGRAHTFPASRRVSRLEHVPDSLDEQSDSQRRLSQHFRSHFNAKAILTFEKNLDQRDGIESQSATAEGRAGANFQAPIAPIQDGANTCSDFIH